MDDAYKINTIPGQESVNSNGAYLIAVLLEQVIAQLNQPERELAEEAGALQQNARVVERLRYGLPAWDQRIMRLRYVDGLRWRKIARKKHFSETFIQIMETLPTTIRNNIKL